MGDYESTILDVKMDFSSLCDRINRRDTTLCDEDWYGITNNFDLGWIEAVYKNINADDMFDVVTKLICSQYATMVAKGQIDGSLPHINDEGIVIDYPEYYLNQFRDEIRNQRAAEELERKTRIELKERMMATKKDAWARTVEVPVPYTSDGEPDVEEYEWRLADQVEDILHENTELMKQVEAKGEEILKLKKRVAQLEAEKEVAVVTDFEILAERLMEYAEEAGCDKSHELFNHLNNLLISIPSWTKNVSKLKSFFREFNKKQNSRNITMTGKNAQYNENNK